MDLDALREALDVWDRFRNPVDGKRPNRERAIEATDPIVKAARAVLDSEEVDWCEVHKCSAAWSDSTECIYRASWPGSYPTHCSIVRVRLLVEERS